MESNVIFIAGGGTGGHIYPGVAIARAILQQRPEIQIRFVGTPSGLETKIVPREGFPLDLIQGGKLNFAGGLFEKIKTLCKIPLGIGQSLILLRKYRPKFVLGVGGYASGPFVLAAALCGIPSAVWEPNAHPGMANRWLSRFVDRCYIVFSQAEKWLKNENTFQFGMPVRKEIEEAKKIARSDQKFHLLSFGGSQGSRAISTVLSDAIVHRGEWTKNLSVVHQIGAVDFAKLKAKYQNSEDIVSPYEFIYDMHNQYAWADLVVARGGASTITELAAFGVVPIIIPLPAADNHQQKNAESLVVANAGQMLLQENLNEQSLITEIEKLRNNPAQMKLMSDNLRKFFQPQAAEKIAADILQQADLK
jgi:UDP-N-acetylglucosamine--N-acetylmuramyl-(pentapeptide) pyrophosphoryl-undecaprenol N-acetylglucosamine transferase